MKNIVAAVLMLSIFPFPSCSAQTVTASQVFDASMLGQTWTFQNSLGDQTFISIESLPPNNGFDSGCLVWNWQKSRGRAYWSPGAIGAGLRFVVCPVQGAWVSAGSLFHGTSGAGGTCCPWSGTSNVAQIPGEQFLAYQTIPASGDSVVLAMPSHFMNYSLNNQETYSSIVGNPSASSRIVLWQTNVYTVNICVPFHNYCGIALVAEQMENCDSTLTNSTCIHEKHYYAPGMGLVQVDVLFQANTWAGFCAHDPDVQQCFTLDQVSIKRTN